MLYLATRKKDYPFRLTHDRSLLDILCKKKLRLLNVAETSFRHLVRIMPYNDDLVAACVDAVMTLCLTFSHLDYANVTFKFTSQHDNKCGLFQWSILVTSLAL